MKLKGGAKRLVAMYRDGYRFHIKAGTRKQFNRAFMMKSDHMIRVRYRHAIRASRWLQTTGSRS